MPQKNISPNQKCKLFENELNDPINFSYYLHVLCKRKRTLSLAIFSAVVLMIFILITGCRDQKQTDYNITCYAATYGKGIYKSTNGGTSWFPLDLEQNDLDAYFKRIYLDPGNKNIIYITTSGNGLFQLNLEQNQLESIKKFQRKNVTALTFSKESKNLPNLWVGFKTDGIFKAPGTSERWQTVNNGLTYRDVNCISDVGNDLYAGTAKDLFKWDQNIQKWLSASKGIKNKHIYSIAADHKNNILYAGSGPYGAKKGRFENIPCLYISKDKGITWNSSDKGIKHGTLIYVIAVNSNRPERVYLGTSDGVYRSINSGQTWAKMKKGLTKNFRAFDIKIARMPDGNDVVYTAGSKGIFSAIDGDYLVWSSKNYGFEPTAVTSIVIVP